MKKEKGFTLIELLLYISIASVIVFTTVYLFQFTLQSRVKNQTIAEVEQQGSQVMQLITQTVRNANTINSPTIGGNGTSLSLTVVDGANSPTFFDLSSGVVRIKEGTGATINLTSSRVSVTNLNFQNLSRAGTPNTIRVEFTITYTDSSGRNEYDFTKTFYGSTGLRK